MTTVRFIGDVHGKFRQYKRIIRDSPPSIQVGDMGVGFYKLYAGTIKADSNPPYDRMVEGNHRFIRGSHDNPSVCEEHRQWIRDGRQEVIDGAKLFFCGGALSVDRGYRTEGLDWWKDEELSSPELGSLIEEYAEFKPDVVVTHDCPESVANEMMSVRNMTKFNDHSRTRVALDEMFNQHEPQLWVFGHWHRSADFLMDGTRFICLAELEYRDIEMEMSSG